MRRRPGPACTRYGTQLARQRLVHRDRGGGKHVAGLSTRQDSWTSLKRLPRRDDKRPSESQVVSCFVGADGGRDLFPIPDSLLPIPDSLFIMMPSPPSPHGDGLT